MMVACAGMAIGATTPANAEVAANGTVLVFRQEFVDTERYVDPSGCTKLPVDAHVLANLTDSDVTIYGDPLCLTFSMVVPPGSGTHTPPIAGSFSV
jgi:hypothetical protein